MRDGRLNNLLRTNRRPRFGFGSGSWLLRALDLLPAPVPGGGRRDEACGDERLSM